MPIINHKIQSLKDKIVCKHGDAFGLDRIVEYKSVKHPKYEIYCNRCCVYFEVMLDNLLHKRTKRGGGHRQCSIIDQHIDQKKNHSQFESDLKKIHGDRILLLEQINGMKNPVKFQCIHGYEDIKSPNNILQTKYCCKQYRNNTSLTSTGRVSFDECVSKIVKRNPNFDCEIGRKHYKNTESVIPVKCNVCCKILWRKGVEHYTSGCFECSNKVVWDTEKFIMESKILFGTDFSYGGVKYSDMISELSIYHNICKNTISITPKSHIYSTTGCNVCKLYSNEKLITLLLKNMLHIDIQYQYKIKLPSSIKTNKVDVFIPKIQLFIEYNGPHHYEPFQYGNCTKDKANERFAYQIIRDRELREYCVDNNMPAPLEIDADEFYGKNLRLFIIDYFITNYPQYIRLAWKLLG